MTTVDFNKWVSFQLIILYEINPIILLRYDNDDSDDN